MVLPKKKCRRLVVVVCSALLLLMLIYTKMAATWDVIINDWRTKSDSNYIMNHVTICSGTVPLQLFVMVISAPGNFDARNAIRDTWGSLARQMSGVQLAFLLGLPIEEEAKMRTLILSENEMHGDVIQSDFLDTYHNLTVKSVAMLHWVMMHCSNARFLLKIDDDCFLQLPNLIDFLASLPEEVAIYGRHMEGTKPHRNNGSKWYVSKMEYPYKYFPPFVNGPSYVYTKAAVPILYATVLEVNPVFHLEDVYLNGVVAERAGIPRIGNDGFNLVRAAEICQNRNFISVHGIGPQQIRQLWEGVPSKNFCEPCGLNWVSFINKIRHQKINAPFVNDVKCN